MLARVWRKLKRNNKENIMKWLIVYRLRFWVSETLTKERAKEIAAYLERKGWAFSIADMQLANKTI